MSTNKHFCARNATAIDSSLLFVASCTQRRSYAATHTYFHFANNDAVPGVRSAPLTGRAMTTITINVACATVAVDFTGNMCTVLSTTASIPSTLTENRGTQQKQAKRGKLRYTIYNHKKIKERVAAGQVSASSSLPLPASYSWPAKPSSLQGTHSAPQPSFLSSDSPSLFAGP